MPFAHDRSPSPTCFRLRNLKQDYRDRGGGFELPDDLEQAKPLWKRGRHWLLPGYIAANPGRRPCIWWLVESPEPLRRHGDEFEVLKLESHFFNGPDKLPQFGRITNIDGRCYRNWESQADFLDRHGLLSDSEKHALTINPSTMTVPECGRHSSYFADDLS